MTCLVPAPFKIIIILGNRQLHKPYKIISRVLSHQTRRRRVIKFNLDGIISSVLILFFPFSLLFPVRLTFLAYTGNIYLRIL